jgi:REP element-mobilizing transposase RayT
MKLNEYCEIARKQWEWLSRQYQYVVLHSFIVMPNHIHGIVSIVDNCRGTACRAPTEKLGRPTPRSLPTIIRSFKSAVTKRINALRGTPGARLWQRNYYEHIIRNEHDLNDIHQYILDNPVKWDMDENNPDRQINEVKPRGELICLKR